VNGQVELLISARAWRAARCTQFSHGSRCRTATEETAPAFVHGTGAPSEHNDVATTSMIENWIDKRERWGHAYHRR
jgi:hypothetical protein